MQFRSSISDITSNDKSTLVIKNVPGKVGAELYERADWERKCNCLFDKSFKDLNAISNIQTNVDPIIDTLSKLSSSKYRVFVFKNYDMVKHLTCLGYDKALLHEKLGYVSLDDISTYLSYAEEKKTIFICHKVKADSNVDQHMRNVTTSIACFLTLYKKKIQLTHVRIIGLLIQETETKKQPLQCKFCDLFSPSYKVFESPTSFNNWLETIETYNNWWDLPKPADCWNLFEDLVAPILGFFHPKLVCQITLDEKDFVPTRLNKRDLDADAANTTWRKENDVLPRSGPFETHRDRFNVVGGPYYVVNKSMESFYPLTRNNRLLFLLFLMSVLLYFCYVFDKSCETYLHINKRNTACAILLLIFIKHILY